MSKPQDLVDYIFTSIPPVYLIIGSTVIFLVMTTFVYTMRAKASNKPIQVKKIILPPLFMSTGMLMFLFDEFQVPWTQVLEASLVGLIFSAFLIKTTKFEMKEDGIYLQKSKAFLIILFSLLILRMIGKIVLSNSIDVGELGGMFFILAFSMILPWRIGMLVKYKKLEKNIK
ncbi:MULTISPECIES: CcdC family protein [unclassified Sporosarcina]|uniref:CcdC family protein n=1 Tax=unclassified Sporosarcina TaxID=2647733 RepID=UPI002041793A|nr:MULTISPECIES: cytochrome c biogenesis protein CcdC [unclassified Sporosarcina]GKV64519.1 protein CcdC [Sporosarcina sp. NCCP-2331]GLB54608.1 protein CcdC [Sporosarcina sp. NCCP-2378]